MSTDVVPSEAEEQIYLVQWLELHNFVFTSVPNSTYTTSWKQKTHNKATGLRPGFPDMVVALPGIGLACIELKRRKGGVVSQFQKDWIATLNQCPGVEARVCLGADEAIAFLQELVPSGATKSYTHDGLAF